MIGGVRGSGHSAEVFDMGAHVRRLWEVDRFRFRKGFDGDFEFDLDMGAHVRRLWEVDRFRFRKGFDGDFEFEQDREVSVSVQVVAGESWSEHHGCSLPGTPMSFSK